MSDKLPGSSSSNPIKYKDWLMCLDDNEGGPMSICVAHRDYSEFHHGDERIAYVGSFDAAEQFVDRWIADEATQP